MLDLEAQEVFDIYWNPYFADALKTFENKVEKEAAWNQGARLREFAPIYDLAAYGLVEGLEKMAKRRMMGTIERALANPTEWSQERLLAQLYGDWQLWETTITTQMGERFSNIYHFQQSYYRPFIRPYAIMVFFYKSLGVVEKIILGGAQAALKLGAVRLGHTWAGPLIAHGLQHVESTIDWVRRIKQLFPSARSALQLFLSRGGAPPVGMMIPAVGISTFGGVALLAAVSLAAGYFLGMAITEVLNVLGVELPWVSEENRQQFSGLPADMLESVRGEAVAVGGEITKIFDGMSEIYGEVHGGKAIKALRPPAEWLVSLEGRLNDLRMEYGGEYLAIVRSALLDEMHNLGDTILAESRKSGTVTAAEFPFNEEVRWMIDWTEVWQIIEPVLAGAEEDVAEDKMEEFIEFAIESRRTELEEYGAALVEKVAAKEQEVNSMTVDEAVAKAVFKAGENAVRLMNEQVEDPSLFVGYLDVMKSGASRLEGDDLAVVNALIMQLEAYMEAVNVSQS